MKPIKHNINDDNNHNKRKKLDNDNETHFEDLYNDIIYEIFDLLDMYHIYQAFFHINKRFEKLVIDSTFHIKINILTMSKLDFQRLYSNVIIPSKHRIVSLALSNLFVIDNILSSIYIISMFNRLEILILDNIEAKYLENILNYTSSLSKLYSLVINTMDLVENSSYFYRQIFKLSALKYCKISFETNFNIESLPMSDNKYSPIQHLVIENTVNFNLLDRILSYVPELRHLKVRYLHGFNSNPTQLYRITLNHLSYISLGLVFISFTQLEKLMKDTFRQVQFLRVSTDDDIEFLDGVRWEQLILSSIPNLRLFHMNHSNSILSNGRIELSYGTLIKKFSSSFWMQRKCSIKHKTNWIGDVEVEIFFSTDDRKKCEKIFKIQDETVYSSNGEINSNAINHLHICCPRAFNKYTNYFPNVTDLTLDFKVDGHNESITNTLNRIIPLSIITKLIIESFCSSFIQLVELICLIPNLHILKLGFISIDDREYTSIQQCQTFQYVSNRNTIKNITINNECTLEKVKMLVALCPGLENLTIGIDKKNLASIIRFLLSPTNAQRLFFLCTLNVPEPCLEEINTLIKLENLVRDYSIKFNKNNLYLWW